MPKKDFTQVAHAVFQQATGEAPKLNQPSDDARGAGAVKRAPAKAQKKRPAKARQE